MGQRIAGVAFVTVGGQQFPLRGNMTVSPSAVERTGIAGQDYVHGYSEMPRVPFIEGDFSLVAGLSMEAIEAITNSTVVAELANGTNYVLRGAWCQAALELSSAEGQVRIRFEGESCDEIA